MSEKFAFFDALTHDRFIDSFIGVSLEKTIPDSNNFCGYVSWTLLDKFSNKPGSIESLKIVWSWLFDPMTEMISEELLFVISYKICLLVKLEFSASIKPKPTITKLELSNFLVMECFDPIFCDTGNGGLRLSIP